jgi:hypothetical protein
MTPNKKTKTTAPTTKTKSPVSMIFDPAGEFHVQVIAPRGKNYSIAPRQAFAVAAEDVDFFRYEWDFEFRQCLSLAKDYQPRTTQFDNGAASKEAGHVHYVEPMLFDNGAANEAQALKPTFEGTAKIEMPEMPQRSKVNALPEMDQVTVVASDDKDKE